MNLRFPALFVSAALAASYAAAQDATPAAEPDSAATLSYIHSAWETLTRSTTDCHSLADIKVTANPVLYLPAEIAQPAEVTEAQQKCNVRVARLPKRIEKIADVQPAQLPAAGPTLGA